VELTEGSINTDRLNMFSPQEREPLEELETDGRIRVNWNLKKLNEALWNGPIWHVIRKNDSSPEHGNGKTCSVNVGEFPD
jgi:hypothetical protein